MNSSLHTHQNDKLPEEMENESFSLKKKWALLCIVMFFYWMKNIFFQSWMEVCSIWLSIRGHQPYTFKGLQEHRLRGQCISSCCCQSLQHREEQEWGWVMLDPIYFLSLLLPQDECIIQLICSQFSMQYKTNVSRNTSRNNYQWLTNYLYYSLHANAHADV